VYDHVGVHTASHTLPQLGGDLYTTLQCAHTQCVSYAIVGTQSSVRLALPHRYAHVDGVGGVGGPGVGGGVGGNVRAIGVCS
jgi:outer membrane lipoprotein SlyB